MAIKWLKRGYVMPTPYIGVVFTPEDFRKAFRSLGVDTIPPYPTAQANVHTLYAKGRDLCCIVTINIPAKDPTTNEIRGLLVHEAVHIAQEVFENMGERSPSSEFQAYTVQGIALQLMNAWDERKKR